MKAQFTDDDLRPENFKVRVDFFMNLALLHKVEKFAKKRNRKYETILNNIIKKYAETYISELSKDKK